MTRKVFFSDCHISAGWGLAASGPNAYPWEWLSAEDNQRLQAFIHWLASRAGEVDEVILVGDIFDNWIFPHDIKPPTLLEILKSPNAAPLMSALQKLSATITMTVLPGNHDLTLSPSLLAQVLPRATFAPQRTVSWGRLGAEHGHLYGLFNAPDPLRPDGLPLGYFISRIVATADRRTGSHTPSVAQQIRELGELIATREELPQGVLDAMCEKAGVPRNATIRMPDDLWGGKDTTVGVVRDLYKNLYQEWKGRNGGAGAVLAISAELNGLALVADRIQLQGGLRALVMGHTHEVAGQQITIPLLGNRIYVNDGTWCHNAKLASWVEAEDFGGSLTLTVLGCTGFDGSGKPEGLQQLMAPVRA